MKVSSFLDPEKGMKVKKSYINVLSLIVKVGLAKIIAKQLKTSIEIVAFALRLNHTEYVLSSQVDAHPRKVAKRF